MKRTVVNLIAGAMIMGGIMTAVSAQAQDRRGGGSRSPQTTQSPSRGSSQSSRPSVSNNNSSGSNGRRPSSSATPQSRSNSSSSQQVQRPQVTQRPQTSTAPQTNNRTVAPTQRPQIEQRQSSSTPSVQSSTTTPSRQTDGNVGRRPSTGNSGTNHWPGNSNSGTAGRGGQGGAVTPGNSNSGTAGHGGQGGAVTPGNSGNGNNNRTGNGNTAGGRRPGDNQRGGNVDNNRNRNGHGPADGGINHNTPGANRPNYDRYRYSSDNRLPQPRQHDRFHDHYRYNDWSWHSPVRPPHRPYRPTGLWYYRPVPPAGFRFYVSAPIISGVLGLEFGTPFSSSLNFLYYNGYDIDGYYDNIVYLRDVPMLNYVWPDVMLQYDNNGLAFIQFSISSSYDDRYRFNRLYNELCANYGTPIRRSGYNGYFSWYGGNGVGYVNLGLTYAAGRYYTSISFGY